MRTCQQQFYTFTFLCILAISVHSINDILEKRAKHNYRTSEVWQPDTLHSSLQSPWERRMWIIGNIAKITILKRTFTWGLKTYMSWALVKQLKFSHGTWSYNIYSYRILSSQVPPYAFRERDEIRSLGLYLGYTSSYHLQIFNYNVYSALLLILHVFLFHVTSIICFNSGDRMDEYFFHDFYSVIFSLRVTLQNKQEGNRR